MEVGGGVALLTNCTLLDIDRGHGSTFFLSDFNKLQTSICQDPQNHARTSPKSSQSKTVKSDSTSDFGTVDSTL